ncbi:cyclic lactone autoinducer peptide [Clostridium sp. CF012]|nr:cyclic lactone autoinducer peptide [Clostridium sp. CF012]
MNILGVVALFVGTIAIVPTSLISSHQPNCPDEFLM